MGTRYHNKLPPLASAEYVNKAHLLDSPEISISIFISYLSYLDLFPLNTPQHYISMPDSDSLLRLSKGVGKNKG